MPFSGATGAAGEIRVGGRPAAGLRDWALRPQEAGRFALSGSLVDPVDLLLDCGRPVEVRLDVGKRIWRWRGGQLARHGAAATVVVEGDWDVIDNPTPRFAER